MQPVLPPLKLGDTIVDPPLCLAPMAGFTDAPMRRIASRYGAAMTFTEMANVRSLADRATASWDLLQTGDGEGPVAAHLYGSEPQYFAKAAEMVSESGRFAAIDINCGCPAPKVTQGGAGAALMKDPNLFRKIVAATVKYSTLPVTVKTRVGWQPGKSTLCDFVKIAADCGAAAVAVHGRYAVQFHAGEVAFDEIARAVSLNLLPILGNGGIRDPQSARQMISRTGVSGILIGWGAVGDPWLFRDLRNFLETGVASARCQIPVREVQTVLDEHLTDLLLFKKKSLNGGLSVEQATQTAEEAVVMHFRCHLFRYLNGMRGVTRLRGKLATLFSLQQVRKAVEEILELETDFRARVGRC